MAKAKQPIRRSPKAQPALLSDLFLTVVDGVVTSTVSPEAQWAGIQRFDDMSSNDGAEEIWGTQRFYNAPPGAGVVTSGPVIGTGYYRGFSSDFDYDVHLSNVVFVP